MKHKRERKDPWLWDKSNRDLGQLEKWKTIARTKTVSHTCKAPLVYKIADWNQQWEDKTSSHREADSIAGIFHFLLRSDLFFPDFLGSYPNEVVNVFNFHLCLIYFWKQSSCAKNVLCFWIINRVLLWFYFLGKQSWHWQFSGFFSCWSLIVA